jgi:glycine/D-amino acid oxidase-like deaminating enzyme
MRDDAVDDSADALPRRDFIKVAGAGAGALLLGDASAAEAAAPRASRHVAAQSTSSSPEIVVIGAGIWGSSTAYHLRKLGAKVTLVDAYGPGNARSTSGDETRGVRSSYGDKTGQLGEVWMLWARESMKRWIAFDEEWGRDFRLNLFHVTGDLIYRTEWDNFQLRCKIWWDKHQIPYEVLKPEDVRKAFPVIAIDDITAILYEPDAGVVRARRATQAVASAFEVLGGRIAIGRATPSKISNGRLEEVALDTGERLRADTFVFAVGPWLGKTFPDVFAKKMRVPIGYVCYFGTPVGDHRFTYPNMPTFNFPGVTGWPALPVDNRGFRVRGTERAPTQGTGRTQPAVPPAQQDPDTSDRWLDQARIDGARRFVAHRFPLLKDAPISQTHACHYEQTSSANFIIDKHPHMSNVWIAAGGNAEGFKFGLKIGDYASRRVMALPSDPTLDKLFTIPEKDYDPPAPAKTQPGKAAAADSTRRPPPLY